MKQREGRESDVRGTIRDECSVDSDERCKRRDGTRVKGKGSSKAWEGVARQGAGSGW